MFSNTVRITLLSVAALVAAFFGVAGLWLQMTAAIVMIILLVAGYFLNGTVFLALRKMSKNDFAGAERLLRMMKYPKYLAPAQKAYYDMIAGLTEAQKGNYQIAAARLEEALLKGLRSQHDKAVACLNLAVIYYNLGNKSKAFRYLSEAKNNKPSPVLQAKIDELDSVLG